MVSDCRSKVVVVICSDPSDLNVMFTISMGGFVLSFVFL